MIKKAQLLDVW